MVSVSIYCCQRGTWSDDYSAPCIRHYLFNLLLTWYHEDAGIGLKIQFSKLDILAELLAHVLEVKISKEASVDMLGQEVSKLKNHPEDFGLQWNLLAIQIDDDKTADAVFIQDTLNVLTRLFVLGCIQCTQLILHLD